MSQELSLLSNMCNKPYSTDNTCTKGRPHDFRTAIFRNSLRDVKDKGKRESNPCFVCGRTKSKPCFVCGRTNHMVQDCYFMKTKEYNPKSKSQKGQQFMYMFIGRKLSDVIKSLQYRIQHESIKQLEGTRKNHIAHLL
ncbi:zinc finger protein [Forsythia ovata]|uniref:Zinc finger protein n=1 Tax=Forsythia ovata TaxID=205694 RepID=A0ABD1WCP0_9LAMI